MLNSVKHNADYVEFIIFATLMFNLILFFMRYCVELVYGNSVLRKHFCSQENLSKVVERLVKFQEKYKLFNKSTICLTSTFDCVDVPYFIDPDLMPVPKTIGHYCSFTRYKYWLKKIDIPVVLDNEVSNYDFPF